MNFNFYITEVLNEQPCSETTAFPEVELRSKSNASPSCAADPPLLSANISGPDAVGAAPTSTSTDAAVATDVTHRPLSNSGRESSVGSTRRGTARTRTGGGTGQQASDGGEAAAVMPLEKRYQLRRELVQELLTTEIEYIHDLKALVQVRGYGSFHFEIYIPYDIYYMSHNNTLVIFVCLCCL